MPRLPVELVLPLATVAPVMSGPMRRRTRSYLCELLVYAGGADDLARLDPTQEDWAAVAGMIVDAAVSTATRSKAHAGFPVRARHYPRTHIELPWTVLCAALAARPHGSHVCVRVAKAGTTELAGTPAFAAATDLFAGEVNGSASGVSPYTTLLSDTDHAYVRYATSRSTDSERAAGHERAISETAGRLLARLPCYVCGSCAATVGMEHRVYTDTSAAVFSMDPRIPGIKCGLCTRTW